MSNTLSLHAALRALLPFCHNLAQLDTGGYRLSAARISCWALPRLVATFFERGASNITAMLNRLTGLQCLHINGYALTALRVSVLLECTRCCCVSCSCNVTQPTMVSGEANVLLNGCTLTCLSQRLQMLTVRGRTGCRFSMLPGHAGHVDNEASAQHTDALVPTRKFYMPEAVMHLHADGWRSAWPLGLRNLEELRLLTEGEDWQHCCELLWQSDIGQLTRLTCLALPDFVDVSVALCCSCTHMRHADRSRTHPCAHEGAALANPLGRVATQANFPACSMWPLPLQRLEVPGWLLSEAALIDICVTYGTSLTSLDIHDCSHAVTDRCNQNQHHTWSRVEHV